MKQEIKSKLREKGEVDYQESVKTESTPLAFSNYRNSDGTNKVTFESTVEIYTKKLATETLMLWGKILIVVTENYEFECRANLKSRSSGVFGLLGFRCKTQNG